MFFCSWRSELALVRTGHTVREPLAMPATELCFSVFSPNNATHIDIAPQAVSQGIAEGESSTEVCSFAVEMLELLGHRAHRVHGCGRSGANPASKDLQRPNCARQHEQSGERHGSCRLGRRVGTVSTSVHPWL